MDLVLKNGSVMLPGGLAQVDIGVRDGKIVAIGSGLKDAADTVDCTGATILPGIIDSQVHFREPGLEHKEDLATGTAAAAMGGVTAICEMPNTKPLTITPETFDDKMQRAAGRAWCDYAFFYGGTAANAHTLAEAEMLPGCAGIKIFMGSSTGDLLLENDAGLEAVLRHGRRRVTVHAEDEPRLRERKALVEGGAHPRMHPEWRDVETAVKATTRLLDMARKVNRRVHVLHITTAEEIDLLAQHKDLASLEVTPQHLHFAAPECYDRLGTLAQMNPPIRDERHRQALWRAVADGTADVLGSDHAPHTLEEKQQPYPQSPSGMTGVQTLVPVMLDHVSKGHLTLERFVDLAAAGPARVHGMINKGRIARGYDADFTIVDLNAKRTINNHWIVSRSGWTPYDGMNVTGWPVMTVIRGQIVMQDGQLMDEPIGAPLRFAEAIFPA